MKQFIPFIIAGMIFYDLSIHLVYLFKKEEFIFAKKLNWWPDWREGSITKISYQVFWSLYWGLGLILILIFLLQ